MPVGYDSYLVDQPYVVCRIDCSVHNGRSGTSRTLRIWCCIRNDAVGQPWHTARVQNSCPVPFKGKIILIEDVDLRVQTWKSAHFRLMFRRNRYKVLVRTFWRTCVCAEPTPTSYD